MAKKEAISKVSKYADSETWNAKGKLNQGDAIDGYYVDREEFETKFGQMVIVILEVADGKFVKITGQSDIKNKFADIPMGSHVWVSYEGLVETTNGTKKAYKVEFDDEDQKAF